jgi:hypothetical protein
MTSGFFSSFLGNFFNLSLRTTMAIRRNLPLCGLSIGCSGMLLLMLTLSVPETAVAAPTPISTWSTLKSSVIAAAGKTVTLTLSPLFTMKGFVNGSSYIALSAAGTVVTIEGNGATFDGGGDGLFFGVGANSPIASATLIVSNVTMKNACNPFGGAINVEVGHLVLTDCTFDSNQGYTGVIAIEQQQSSVTLTRCSFVSNAASAGDGGGALWFDGGSFGLIIDCLFTGPIYKNHNDIARDNTNAVVTFACADSEVGTPVQMQGTDITVIPPKELQCIPRK